MTRVPVRVFVYLSYYFLGIFRFGIATQNVLSSERSMDLNKVLAQLRMELENLDAAILSLERLQQEGPRRGRPPKTLSAVTKSSLAAPKESDVKEADAGES